MKKIIYILITIIIVLVGVIIYSFTNYFYFNTRISNIENTLKNNLIDTTELKTDMNTIHELSNNILTVNDKLNKIEVEKVNVINYLVDVMIISNEFLEYSKSIYDEANNFLKFVRSKGMNTISIKEITDIENDLDRKDNTILNLTKKYNDLLNDYNEVNKLLYSITSN